MSEIQNSRLPLAGSVLLHSDNSGYAVRLRSSKPFATLRASPTRRTLYDIPPLRRIRKYKNSRIIVNYGG